MGVRKFNAAVATAITIAAIFLESALVSAGDSSDLKPHFLYMERLRKHLDDSQIALPDKLEQETAEQGQLVATSFETQTVEERGEDEFSKSKQLHYELLEW